MRKCCFALVLLSMCAWTQSLPIEQPTEAVVAVINGRKITSLSSSACWRCRTRR